jgi:hypothetical protein
VRKITDVKEIFMAQIATDSWDYLAKLCDALGLDPTGDRPIKKIVIEIGGDAAVIVHVQQLVLKDKLDEFVKLLAESGPKVDTTTTHNKVFRTNSPGRPPIKLDIGDDPIVVDEFGRVKRGTDR